MQLLTFTYGTDPQTHLGVLRGDAQRVVDLGAAARQLGMTLPFDPSDMLSLIAAGAPALAAARELAERAADDLVLATVRLQAPIARPRKNIFCVGWNYVEHFAEGAKIRPHVKEIPAHPTFFTKAPTTMNGPRDDVPFFAALSAQLDWEVELALVIGRGGRDIAEERALQHVFGYAVLNDISWRDVQRRHGQQWFKGKSIDGTCPMGPWITTADALDPTDLRLQCRVNGVVKQEASTAQMHFKIARIIAELSQGMTLEPGDIIATGTPSGVGHARQPPEFLKPGDMLESEIAGLGCLRNAIVAA